MTDLVAQLRSVQQNLVGGLCVRAADRIEKLVEENGALFAANVRLNSRADLDSDGYVDRIEKLEAALHQWDDLIVQQFTGSKAAMSAMTEAAQITAAMLHGEAPWPETRIEKLEDELHHCFHRINELQAALREIIQEDALTGKTVFVGDFGKIARKALEGKDGKA